MAGRADAIPHAAGGEGGHGAARPEGVIHRCLFNKMRLLQKDLIIDNAWISNIDF